MTRGEKVVVGYSKGEKGKVRCFGAFGRINADI
jgi:hypothetical protein